MVTKRPDDEIRENDIVAFIIAVRKFSCQTTDIARNMQRIKNLANTIFRHYIGYTARGEYRLRFKDEQCFKEDLEKRGIRTPFGKLRRPNPNLERPVDADLLSLVEAAGDRVAPGAAAEFVDLDALAREFEEAHATAGDDDEQADVTDSEARDETRD